MVIQEAARRGANAVLGLRVDAGGVSGTAVRVTPVSPSAIKQYQDLVRAGQAPPLS
ncbi:hypothetical protein [Krasilnikovia sp. MM14-A1004]|uniref:hypothetical protein n=1 Tax=Krasilnikovia sp. MM14-A1004 TaxID=3373541 RepID=UPI00399C4D7E